MALNRPLKFASKSLLLVTSTLMLVTLGSVANAANIYRYEDDSGRMVWDSKIPARFVKKGYTILNERGDVIEVVPPALTAEQLQEQANILQAQREEDERLRKQLEADNLLLRLYRSPEEIAVKRDERLKRLDDQIAVLSVNASKLESAIAEAEQVVANYRKADKEPPEPTLKQLEENLAEQGRLSAQLGRNQTERQKVEEEASRDIQRMRELLGLSE